MRILFTRFPLASALGGAEIQTLSLMDGLAARGHAVAFLGSCPTLLAETRRRQLPCAELHIGPPPVTKWGALSFGLRRWKMQEQLRKALNEFSSLDAVCMLSLSEKLLLTKPLADRGIKVYWVEHDRVGPWLRRNPWLPELLRISRHATTVCVSELSRSLYLRMGWKPATVVAIPNGIDPNRFAAHEHQAHAGGPLRIGCVARLSKEKGVDVLIHAAATMPGILVDIVGTGPEEGFLCDEIGRLGLQQRVRIISKPADLGVFYASLDALVLPSRDHDPFGLAAAEAMAMGIPAVVTDQCGIAELLRNGEDALVTRADDADALRTALEQLENAEMRKKLGENGKRTARERMTAAAMVDRYEALMRA